MNDSPGASVLPGAAAPGEVQSSPRKPSRSGLVLALLALVVLAGGAAAYGLLTSFGEPKTDGALTYRASREPLQVTVVADGNVESASNLEVKCRVAGGSTILWIVEDGKVVQEGDEIVKLDTSAIDDKLNAQRITYEKALATQIQAQEDLAAATISVKEYEEGTFVETLKLAESAVQIALENLRTAENQLNYSMRMVRKGFVGSLQREADEFAVQRAKLDLEAANLKKQVLVDFTKPKTLKDLEAKRDAAAARLRSEEASLKLEKARLDRLQEQLKNCIITAPKAGMVVYANDSRSSRFGSSGQSSQVEEGAMVRESQALVRLPDLSKMQVKVTIHESRIDQVRPGLAARVVIQDQEYPGRVLNVANQPQAASWYSASVKEYATIVAIEGQTGVLKPGMTAKVSILISEAKDALVVPVSSVVEQRGKFFAWTRDPGGKTERRELKLGRTNDKLIEVIDGVKQGDEVLRNPRAMVADARTDEPFEQQVGDTQFKSSADKGASDTPPAPGAPANGAAPGPAARENGNKGPEGSPPAAAAGKLPGAPVILQEGKGAASAAGDRKAPPGEEKAAGGGGGPGGEPGSKRGGRGNFDPLQFDKDGDKKLSREELPEFLQSRFDSLDLNSDGSLDDSEIAKWRSSRSSSKSRPPRDASGGEEGRTGGAPESPR